jgi:hypothetical protein
VGFLDARSPTAFTDEIASLRHTDKNDWGEAEILLQPLFKFLKGEPVVDRGASDKGP